MLEPLLTYSPPLYCLTRRSDGEVVLDMASLGEVREYLRREHG